MKAPGLVCFLLAWGLLAACTSTQTPAPSPALLTSPDPEALLRVLNYGISLERNAWEKFDYGSFHGDFLTSPEARALFDFVQADLARHFPDEIPQAGRVFSDRLLDPDIWFPPRAVWTLAQHAVVDLLRGGPHKLTPGAPLPLFSGPPPALFTLTPVPLELDGDPGPEWLVEVDSTVYNLRGWLPLDEQEGQYALIPNDLRHENQFRAQGIRTQIAPDLNGDGLAEFIVRFDGQPLGSLFGYLAVYGRAGLGFYRLDVVQLGPGEAVEIADVDGDGRSEIRVTIPRTLNFGCAWEQHHLYRWQGEARAYAVLNESPPETALCDAARTLSPLAGLSPSERAARLERALAALSSDGVPSEDYLALLRIHLAMAYAAQGLDEQAAAQLTGLPIWAATVWDETRHSFPAFCNALYAAAGRGALDSTGLLPYLTPGAMFQAYGETALAPGALVCPLAEWVQHRLEILAPPVDRVPGEFWPELGAALSGVTPYQLDGDPAPEWIGWLDWQLPQFLLLDPGTEAWRIVRLAGRPSPLAQFQSHVADFDADGLLEILLLATFDQSVPVSAYPDCWAQGAAQISDLIVVRWPEVEETSVALCGAPPALEELPAAQLQEWFTASIPSPPTLATDPNGFYRRLEAQEARIVMGEDPAGGRAALEKMILEVPSDHPAAGAVIPRLVFGIGLSYEVEGDAESARAVYLDVVARWPASPWAWLAEARMGN